MARTNRRQPRPIASPLSRLVAAIRTGFVAPSARTSVVGAVLTTIGIAAVVAWGVPHLRARIDERQVASDGPPAIAYVDAPRWFDQIRRDRVAARVMQAVGESSTLDPHRLAKARDALMTTGWFDSIEQVRLADSGGFIVEARFVQPFAIVRHDRFDYLVDPSARVLPMEWPAGHRPAEPHYVTIVGASAPPPGENGVHWAGSDVAAGLELVKLIADRPWFGEVAGIDVSGHGASNQLVLVTSGNGRLVWGRSPGDRSAAEVPAETKLRTLDYLYASNRRIDNGSGRTIDLRGDLVTVRRNDLAAEGAPGRPETR